MDIICEDYVFCKNGIYNLNQKQHGYSNLIYTDIVEVPQEMRLYGTKEQIDKYITILEEKGCMIDECYTFAVETDTTVPWYNAKDNLVIADRLKKYGNMYLDNNKELLIINIH